MTEPTPVGLAAYEGWERAELRADLLADYANELRGEISALEETNALQARLISAQLYILKVHGILEEGDG